MTSDLQHGRALGLLVLLALVAPGVARGEEGPVEEGAESGPAASPPGAGPRGTLAGRVIERGSRDPVGGALVRWEGEAVEADEDGRFELEAAPGRLALRVEMDGYLPATARARVVDGVRRRVVVTLDRRPDLGEYETVVRASPYPEETTRVSLSGPELRTVPGTSGDPLRVMETLPSVLPIVSMLPYYFVRGAPPSATTFLLDGVRLPTLFHFGLAQPVVHPALIVRVDFFPGGAPAEIGWHVGGALRARTRRIRADRVHAEWEAGLTELNGIVQAPLSETVRVSVSGRYSLLGYWLQLFSPGMGMQVADYQARLEWDVSPGHRLSLLGLGAFSGLTMASTDPDDEGTDLRIQFHRVVSRYELLGVEGLVLEGRAWLGFDETGPSAGRSARMWAAGPQLALRWSPLAWLDVVAGAEVEARWFPGIGEVDEDDDWGLLFSQRDSVLAGSHLSVVLRPTPSTHLTLGGRFDLYAVGDDVETWVDLRAALRHRFAPFLALHAEVGTFHQPQSFVIHLPGLESLPIDAPPQSALQVSQGVEVTLPWALTLDVQAYFSTFEHLSEVDPSLDDDEMLAFLTLLASPSELAFPSGRSYGIEVQLRRRLGETLYGWISYTLSRTERDYAVGRAPHDSDQTHVLNAVLSWYVGWGLRLGARVLLTSGKPYTPARCVGDPSHPFGQPEPAQAGPYNGERLPPFFRLDLRVDKEWSLRDLGLALFFELSNATFTVEPLGTTCDCDEVGGQYVIGPPIPLFGFQLGLRGVY